MKNAEKNANKEFSFLHRINFEIALIWITNDTCACKGTKWTPEDFLFFFFDKPSLFLITVCYRSRQHFNVQWNYISSFPSLPLSLPPLSLSLHIYIYVVLSIVFQTFFVQAFIIVVDSWKFNMLWLYILWDDWPIFMIPGSNQQLQQQLEYTIPKSDFHSWWISKIQSRHEDT